MGSRVLAFNDVRTAMCLCMGAYGSGGTWCILICNLLNILSYKTSSKILKLYQIFLLRIFLELKVRYIFKKRVFLFEYSQAAILYAPHFWRVV